MSCRDLKAKNNLFLFKFDKILLCQVLSKCLNPFFGRIFVFFLDLHLHFKLRIKQVGKMEMRLPFYLPKKILFII